MLGSYTITLQKKIRVRRLFRWNVKWHLIDDFDWLVG